MPFLSVDEQINEIKSGLVDFISEKELRVKLQKSIDKNTPLVVKAGFDPTRPDLHLGHTVLINKMRLFQKLGHQVVFLIGDFTAQIGDPTGKNETRPALTKDDIIENSKTYSDQVFKILDREKTMVRYNSEWMEKFTPSDFIKLAASYNVARMLERDDFEKRYKSGISISIHEFLYPLVQGYDSVALKADIELGGTDQKFNLLVGRDLQKNQKMAQQVVLTVPILEGTDGVNKMSKSLNNYIALEDTPTDMFGKVMRISDELMLRYYQLLTEISSKEFEELKNNLLNGDKNPRNTKVDLAKIIVTRFYDKTLAQKAEDEFNRIFKNKGIPDNVPEHVFSNKEFTEKFSSLEKLDVCLLVKGIGLTPSTSEVRRLLKAGAISIDGQKLSQPQLDDKHLEKKKFLLKVGKKKFAYIVISE